MDERNKRVLRGLTAALQQKIQGFTGPFYYGTDDREAALDGCSKVMDRCGEIMDQCKDIANFISELPAEQQ